MAYLETLDCHSDCLTPQLAELGTVEVRLEQKWCVTQAVGPRLDLAVVHSYLPLLLRRWNVCALAMVLNGVSGRL